MALIEKLIDESGYFYSDCIKVYPCAYRGANESGAIFNPESRLNTEYNFTHSSALIGKDTYITDKYKDNDTTISFFIKNYLFTVGVKGDSSTAPEVLIDAIKKLVGKADVETGENKFIAKDYVCAIKIKNVGLLSADTTQVLENLKDSTNQSLDEKITTDEGDKYVFTGLKFCKASDVDPTWATLSLAQFSTGATVEDYSKVRHNIELQDIDTGGDSGGAGTFDLSELEVKAKKFIQVGTDQTNKFDGQLEVTGTISGAEAAVKKLTQTDATKTNTFAGYLAVTGYATFKNTTTVNKLVQNNAGQTNTFAGNLEVTGNTTTVKKLVQSDATQTNTFAGNLSVANSIHGTEYLIRDKDADSNYGAAIITFESTDSATAGEKNVVIKHTEPSFGVGENQKNYVCALPTLGYKIFSSIFLTNFLILDYKHGGHTESSTSYNYDVITDLCFKKYSDNTANGAQRIINNYRTAWWRTHDQSKPNFYKVRHYNFYNADSVRYQPTNYHPFSICMGASAEHDGQGYKVLLGCSKEKYKELYESNEEEFFSLAKFFQNLALIQTFDTRHNEWAPNSVDVTEMSLTDESLAAQQCIYTSRDIPDDLVFRFTTEQHSEAIQYGAKLGEISLFSTQTSSDSFKVWNTYSSEPNGLNKSFVKYVKNDNNESNIQCTPTVAVGAAGRYYCASCKVNVGNNIRNFVQELRNKKIKGAGTAELCEYPQIIIVLSTTNLSTSLTKNELIEFCMANVPYTSTAPIPSILGSYWSEKDAVVIVIPGGLLATQPPQYDIDFSNIGLPPLTWQASPAASIYEAVFFTQAVKNIWTEAGAHKSEHNFISLDSDINSPLQKKWEKLTDRAFTLTCQPLFIPYYRKLIY